MRPRCSICRYPRSAEMIAEYARAMSYRRTAAAFGVGYRSLHRHMGLCLPAIVARLHWEQFNSRLAAAERAVRMWYAAERRPKPPPRRRSIITKPVEFTWSRRAWGRRKKLEPTHSAGRGAIKLSQQQGAASASK